MKTRFISIATLFLSVSLATSLGFAQNAVSGSGAFSLQGRLTSTTGSAIADGQHMLKVQLYTKGSGQAMYSEMDTVSTSGGIFSTMVGANSSLNLNSRSAYEIGVSVDGQAELLPRIQIGQALQAITAATADSARFAADARTVGGFTVDSGSIGLPHSLLALNGQGRVNAGLLDSSSVTSINGVRGAVSILGGGNLHVATTHDSLGTALSLSFTGQGGGLNLPFTQSVDLASGAALNITNTLAGSAASFSNTGLGAALQASSMTGSAINATSTGAVQGAATINAQSSVGTAVNAVSNSGAAINASASGATSAVLQVQNTSQAASASLISAVNGTGSHVFTLGANGATQIQSSATTALDASTTATGGVAAKLTGGLQLIGPTGTGSISAGQATATINNAYVKANSLVFVTLSSAAGISIPLTVTSVSNGSFSIAPVGGAVLANTLTFNYLVVNQ